MSFRVNLALAYTELTEELGRLRELSSLQGRILRTLLQEQARSGGEMGQRRGGPVLDPEREGSNGYPPESWGHSRRSFPMLGSFTLALGGEWVGIGRQQAPGPQF